MAPNRGAVYSPICVIECEKRFMERHIVQAGFPRRVMACVVIFLISLLAVNARANSLSNVLKNTSQEMKREGTAVLKNSLRHPRASSSLHPMAIAAGDRVYVWRDPSRRSDPSAYEVRILLQRARPFAITAPPAKAMLHQVSVDCAVRSVKVRTTKLFKTFDVRDEPLHVESYDEDQRLTEDLQIDPAQTEATLFKAACRELSVAATASLPADVNGDSATSGIGSATEIDYLRQPYEEETESAASTPEQVAAMVGNAARQQEIGHLRESLEQFVPFSHRQSRIPLGVLARLSDYVYVSEEKLKFGQAVLSALEEASRSQGQTEPEARLVNAALKRQQRRVDKLASRLNEKVEFLHENGLKPVVIFIPNSEVLIESFYAEVYFQPDWKEYVVVFRGSQEPLDWISNIWLGLDLKAGEAPHYAAARKHIDHLLNRAPTRERIPKAALTATGHSLGGGLSQYVGLTYGIKAVAFNSSPLPERYLPHTSKVDRSTLRVYSAIERTPAIGTLQPRHYPDPVSVTMATARSAENPVRSFFLSMNKANQHVVVPTCVLSEPVPYLTKDEEQEFLDFLNRMYSPSSLSKVVKLVKATVTEDLPETIAKEIGIPSVAEGAAWQWLASPVWRNPRASRQEERVWGAAREAVTIETYESIGAMKAAVDMGRITFGVMGFKSGGYKAGQRLAKGIAIAEVKSLAKTSLLMPHDMNRFVRGMYAFTDADAFDPNVMQVGCGRQMNATYR